MQSMGTGPSTARGSPGSNRDDLHGLDRDIELPKAEMALRKGPSLFSRMDLLHLPFGMGQVQMHRKP